MSDINVHTGPGGLMTLSTNASQREIDAYFYTFTKAQQTARTRSTDPTSDAYFTAMTDALGPLGWTQIRATPYTHRPGGNPITPLTAMVDAFLQILSAIPFLQLDVKTVNRWLADAESVLASPPPAIETQLDAWWDGTRSGDARAMTVGPLTDILGTPWLGAAHVSLTLTGDSWRTLITPSSSFGLSAAPVVMSLNWVAYGLVEDQLKAKLKAELDGHLSTAKLDLGADQLGAA